MLIAVLTSLSKGFEQVEVYHADGAEVLRDGTLKLDPDVFFAPGEWRRAWKTKPNDLKAPVIQLAYVYPKEM